MIIPVDREGEFLYNAIVTFGNRTEEQYEFWKKVYAGKLF